MRYMLNQLRYRKHRAVALGLAILIASASFSLLLSTVRTSRLTVVGTVTQSFRPAYDILVRPRDSFTSLERDEGLVRSNYLSGIFGGISQRQYREVKRLPGVEIAAPIANIGFILPFDFVPLRINRVLDQNEDAALYRLHPEWHANQGLSRYPDDDQYVYYTTLNPMRVNERFDRPREVLSDGTEIAVCEGFSPPEPPSGHPFTQRGRENLTCFSSETTTAMPSGTDFAPFPPGVVGGALAANFPVLVAAIDPAQEEQLLDLSSAVTSGRPLHQDDGAALTRISRSSSYKVVPLIASSRSYVDEELVVDVQRLAVPEPDALRRRLADNSAYRFATELEGTSVGSLRLPIGPIYEGLIDDLDVPAREIEIAYNGYWTATSTTYEGSPDGILKAQEIRNRPKVFASNYYGDGWAPHQLRDTQFRKLTFHQASSAFTGRVLGTPALRVVGRFDPELLPGFSPLSEVPLETYYPPTIRPIAPEVEATLDGQPLLPNMNIGGYIAQPPLMLTTLKAARAMFDPSSFEGANETAPISVIRVRVAGVQGPDPLSRERIRLVAEAIHEQTGLAVDVTAGSSPRDLRVQLPAGRFGQPPMTVREGWIEKGVAVSFLDAVDRKSLLLFILVLAVCTLFLANGGFASVTARRRELGVLSCLGWTRRELFGAVLGESVAVGAIAGIAGTVLVWVLVSLLDLRLPVWQALLVAPVSVLVTAAAGVLPAYRASRLEPLDALQPPVKAASKGRRVSSIVRMAVGNVVRVPARTILGCAGLFLGIAAFTVIVAINSAFGGQLAGTVLGRFISIEVRGPDLLSVGLIMVLGAASVADVLMVNTRERSIEFATLSAVGWSAGELRWLFLLEGVALGLLGSAAGAAAGAALTFAIPGLVFSDIAGSALVSVLVGCALAAVASVVLLPTLARLSVAQVFAEE